MHMLHLGGCLGTLGPYAITLAVNSFTQWHHNHFNVHHMKNSTWGCNCTFVLAEVPRIESVAFTLIALVNRRTLSMVRTECTVTRYICREWADNKTKINVVVNTNTIPGAHTVRVNHASKSRLKTLLVYTNEYLLPSIFFMDTSAQDQKM